MVGSELITFFNGKLFCGCELDLSCLPMNYSQLLGEGPFTTIKVVDGAPLLMPLHFKRLELSIDFLFQKNISEFREKIESGIELILKQSCVDHSQRINFFKKLNGDLDFFILRRPIKVPPKKVKLGVSKIIKGQGIFPSFLKMGPFSEVFYELEKRKDEGIDDLIHLNHRGEVLECSTSNIFVRFKKGIIKTPTIQNGVLDGIMRKVLISFLKTKNIDVIETLISEKELANADEIITTNALHCLRSVDYFNTKKLNQEFYNKFHDDFENYVREYDKEINR